MTLIKRLCAVELLPETFSSLDILDCLESLSLGFTHVVITMMDSATLSGECSSRYREYAQAFADVEYRNEMLIVSWRSAAMGLIRRDLEQSFGHVFLYDCSQGHAISQKPEFLWEIWQQARDGSLGSFESSVLIRDIVSGVCKMGILDGIEVMGIMPDGIANMMQSILPNTCVIKGCVGISE